jgi:acetyltransferase-like isoleucine patch superfamily enzyme
MFFALKRKINLFLFRKKWRKQNEHNDTYPVIICPMDIVTVGKSSYGPIYARYWGHANEKLVIGSYCSIAEGVKFLLGGNHRYDTLFSFPIKAKLSKEILDESYSKGAITVEDDVWIGVDAIILSGVKIGKGAIIGASAVVSKDVPPFSIVVGNPARVIKKRFSSEIIDYLLEVDYNLLNFENLNELNLDELCASLKDTNDAKMKIKSLT